MTGRTSGLQCERRRMSAHEELFLNPFEKWSRYGRFPTQFFLHALLVACVTFQVMYYLRRDITHACHSASHFSSLFLGTARGSVTIRQPGELQDAVENAVKNLFIINDVTFNDVVLAQGKPKPEGDELLEDVVADPDELQSLPIFLRFRNGTVRRAELSRKAFLQEKKQVQAYLQRTLPILYCREVRELEAIVLSMELVETVHLVGGEGHFVWNLTLKFDGTNVGRFVGTLSYAIATSGHGFAGLSNYSVNELIICLALVSLVLIARKVLRSLYVLRMLRCAMRSQGAPRLTWREELALFSWWWALSATCHCVQIAVSWASLRSTPNVTDRFSLLGWSCCLTWLNICQYLEFFPGYYVTFSTTGKGMASVCRYMASVLPILTAFMFLGTCHFWQASFFQDVQASYASLFSLLNGDMVHDAFEELGNIGGFAGHLYLYVFIFFFIYIILNVNITIIEEAYYSAHFQGLKHEEQVESAKKLMTPLETPNWGLPKRNSEEFKAEAHTVVEEPDVDTGACITKASSRLTMPSLPDREAPRLPNLVDSGNSSPLLKGRASNTEAVARSQLLVKGSVSPRILEHPRLQGALSAAFPVAGELTPGRNRGEAMRKLSTWSFRGSARPWPWPTSSGAGAGAGVVAGHGVGQAVGSAAGQGGELSPGSAQTSVVEDLREAAAGDLAACGPGSGRAEWWLTVLPRLTQLLRSTPLPSRSEVTQLSEGSWEELERLVADHSGAISEVSAALYRELART